MRISCLQIRYETIRRFVYDYGHDIESTGIRGICEQTIAMRYEHEESVSIGSASGAESGSRSRRDIIWGGMKCSPPVRTGLQEPHKASYLLGEGSLRYTVGIIPIAVRHVRAVREDILSGRPTSDGPLHGSLEELREFLRPEFGQDREVLLRRFGLYESHHGFAKLRSEPLEYGARRYAGEDTIGVFMRFFERSREPASGFGCHISSVILRILCPPYS